VNLQLFRNATISDNGGWRIGVEADTWDFEFDDPAKNNTCSNNESGDVLVLP